LLEPKELEHKAGGFSVPADSERKPEIGTVLEKGDRVWDEAKAVYDAGEYEEGDILAHAPYTAKELDLDGKKYKFVAFADVIAKLEEQD
jgi:co-chaperonin GroES (HSP10)